MIGQIDGGTLDVMYLEKQGDYNAQQDTNELNATSMDAEMSLNLFQIPIRWYSRELLDKKA